MKQIIIITGIIAFVCILLTSGYPSYGTGTDGHSTAKAAEISRQEESGDESIEETSYTLKEYRSRLAVFKNNNSLPIYVTNVFINDLPKADRNELSKGLTVKTRRELDRLIEDYCS